MPIRSSFYNRILKRYDSDRPNSPEMTSNTSNIPQSTFPTLVASFASEDLVIGGGVAIFHLATNRVVICSQSDHYGRKYYFLPKGRRDAGEESGTGAEREGYEESGYRNRVLPLPTRHRQPQAHPRVSDTPPLTAEPVWMQLLPMLRSQKQYVLYWYIAETIPPDLEDQLVTNPADPYKPPPPYPADLKLKDRVKMESEGYQPIRHEDTGVDEEEKTYESYLVSVDEAIEKLGGSKGGIMADVVRRGWQGICDRRAAEEGEEVNGNV